MSQKRSDYGLIPDDRKGSIQSFVPPAVTRRSKLIIVVACLVIATFLLAISLAIYFSVSSNGSEDENDLDCITPDVCNSKILKYIDNRFDPCDDFYRYSCGNWLSANPLNNRNQWGTFAELMSNNREQLSKYLSQPVQKGDPDAIKKSKYVYSACKNSDYIQNNLKKHLQGFIRFAGGWGDIGIFPDSGWDADYNLAVDHYLGSSAFFSHRIEPDDLNSSKPVIKIRQGGLSLATPQKYYNSTGEDFLGLVETIKTFLGVVSADGHDDDISLIATNVANYERLLALSSLTDTELRNVSALYHPMELEEFSTLFNLDWVHYFEELSVLAGFNLSFTDDTLVIVETPEYFRNASKLFFNATDYNTTVNYARWQLLHSEVTNYAAFLSSSQGVEAIHNIEIPLDSTTSLSCATITEALMPFAVARPFVEEFITDKTIQKVNETVVNMFETFVERIMENDWLDSYTKDQCIDKVDAITKLFAYPDFVNINSELDRYYEKFVIKSSDDYFEIVRAHKVFQYFQQLTYYTKPIDRTMWQMQAIPTQVNAFYSAPFNQITILAGILRIPTFALNWPPFLLYGRIGTVIGHEITHGFDNRGQQFNKDGNRVKWWTDESIAQFDQRIQCFVDQYDQYSLQGYPIDGQLTLGENIADNGGVHTAFQAYRNTMNAIEKQSLIGGHTLDQLFFVAFAQLWCSKFSDNYLETQTDTHSPGPIRVLGSLVNNKEFATAFNCPVGTRMNPREKCQLW